MSNVNNDANYSSCSLPFFSSSNIMKASLSAPSESVPKLLFKIDLTCCH